MKKIFFAFAILSLLVNCDRNHRSDAYGNFEAVEITVSAESTGKIIWLDLEEGQAVSSGTTLGLVDTTDLALKREQLMSQVAVIHARLQNIDAQVKVQEQQRKNLQVDRVRVENLRLDGAATQKQLDDINGSIDVLEQQILATSVQKASVMAELGTLDVQVAQLKENIRRCWIVSPSDGTVLAKYAEPGEVTSYGRPIAKIADLSKMELKIYISGDQLPYLKIGREVDVFTDKDLTGLQQHTGTVTWISEKAEFTPKTIQTKQDRVNLVYAAKVIVQNDGTLKIGMPGEVNFMNAEE
jgi:HlyD family secretion protein